MSLFAKHFPPEKSLKCSVSNESRLLLNNFHDFSSDYAKDEFGNFLQH